ncbi:MAG: D-alanine--D-alanine ligase [Bacteroidales bacterium]|jgi:D-alanine-D-alanine ligase|nr:D-alanine--D-alanine ligase [Bacteroidales bacterium]
MRTIAIVAGGNSSEYPVSVRSAEGVSKALKGKYQTYIITIKNTDWYWEDPKGRIFPIDKNDFSLALDDQHVRFDAAFIAIHGNPGENGLLQGYFDMTGIPYTSCDAFVSALTFNKQACKLYLNEYGIPMTGGLLLRRGQKYDAESIVKQTGLPCFVKPNASGSSFGVTKVKETAGFDVALEHAFAEGNEVLVESFMKGTEVACGVVRTKQKKIIMPVTEIVPKKEFFDYEAKYTDGLSDEITPARMPEEITARIQELSSEIYDILGCRGIVRVDFIVTDDGPQFLEINTIPGMTPESIIPRQAAVFGISQTDLYSMVIEDLF